MAYVLNDKERGDLCQTGISCLHATTGNLKSFPGLIKAIIENKAWEKRETRGRVIKLNSLRELITERPVAGWGEDPKKVEAVIKDHPEVLTMYREAMVESPGKRAKADADISDNISNKTSDGHGTAKAYTLSRLEREAPELFRDVCDGKTTANAAAIKAGFRQKTFTVVAGDSVRAVKSLLKHYSKDDILDAIAICD
tara:strand:- start:375 stop:965 length:591 start_codon:yes stop_codon:yes gene_type:complete